MIRLYVDGNMILLLSFRKTLKLEQHLSVSWCEDGLKRLRSQKLKKHFNTSRIIGNGNRTSSKTEGEKCEREALQEEEERRRSNTSSYRCDRFHQQEDETQKVITAPR